MQGLAQGEPYLSNSNLHFSLPGTRQSLYLYCCQNKSRVKSYTIVIKKDLKQDGVIAGPVQAKNLNKMAAKGKISDPRLVVR